MKADSSAISYLITYSWRTIRKPCVLRLTLAMSKAWIYKHPVKSWLQSCKHVIPETWKNAEKKNQYNYWSSRRAEVWRYEKSFINSRGTWLEPCSTSIWFALHAAGLKLQRFQWPRKSAEGGANPWWNCNIFKLLHLL